MKKAIFGVFHTTESGADYIVKAGLKNISEAQEWVTENREKYPRPLIIRKLR